MTTARLFCLLALGLGPLLTASPARAEGALKPGVEVGLRLGYGLPLGSAEADNKLSDGVSGKLPIQLDAGYRLIPALHVGAYLEYAFNRLASEGRDNCNATQISCTSHDVRFGVSAQYHLFTAGTVLPWVGLGAGYEILSSRIDQATTTVRGFEFFHLQGGADFPLPFGLRAGPFLQLSVGEYTHTSVSGSRDYQPDPNNPNTIPGNSIDRDESIASTALHGWFTLGIRGVFAP